MIITAGEVKAKFDALMDGFDRYQWKTYKNPLTKQDTTPTAQELTTIKGQAPKEYADLKALIEGYAEQIGMGLK